MMGQAWRSQVKQAQRCECRQHSAFFSAALPEAESPCSPSRAASVRGVCFAKRRERITRGLLEVKGVVVWRKH